MRINRLKNLLPVMLLAAMLAALAGCAAFPDLFAGVGSAPTEESAKGLETRPGALDAVQKALADELALPMDQVTLQEYREVQWPDACLGFPEPGEVCAQTITPGYLMIFKTPDGMLEVHSNRGGDHYRYTPAQPQAGDRPVVAVWERSGGIAGICQRLFLYADGGYLLQECIRNKLLAQGDLEPEALEQLKQWSGRYQSFAWKVNLPAGSADMFNDSLRFTGQGQETASEQEQEAMFNTLADTVAELVRGAGE